MSCRCKMKQEEPNGKAKVTHYLKGGENHQSASVNHPTLPLS